MILLLIFAFLGVALFELPELIQKRYRRDLITVCLILFIGFNLSLLLLLGFELPNPLMGLTNFFQNFLHLSYKLD